jgi:CubicO group peptidase (beta-lactamase class C family)
MYAEFIGPNNKNISQMKNSEFIAKLLQLPLKAQPGTKYYYSLSTDVIGAVIEKITGQTLGQYLQHEIFDKLEMIDTCFNLPDEKRHRLVSLHGISSEGLLQVANPEEQLRGNVNLEFESGGGG